MSWRKSLVGQFKKPHGLLGRLAGMTMYLRPSNRERNKWTVDLLDLSPDDRVLEIGYGPGFAAGIVARKLKKGRYIGIDHSRSMQVQAGKRNARHIRKGTIAFLCGDLADAGLQEVSFDKVFSCNVVQFWQEPEGDFARVRALLKPGALCATTYMPRSQNADRGDAEAFASRMSQIMTKVGFNNVRIEWLEVEPVPAVCILANA